MYYIFNLSQEGGLLEGVFLEYLRCYIYYIILDYINIIFYLINSILIFNY